LRQIGTLPGTADPRVFADYLLSLGVSSRAVESKDGWAIWVHNEDLVPKAREEFEAYQKDPEDPRFRAAASTATEIRNEERKRERLYRKRVRDMSGRYDSLNVRGRPLTVALMAACIALHVATMTTPSVYEWLHEKFGFFSSRSWVLANKFGVPDAGLSDIQHGEVWRLITPIFLHVGFVHLIFNMSAIWYEGTLIEYCRGTRAMLVLVLLSAVTSNIGEYLYQINFTQRLVPWFGISGVGYAMFGYIWMKSKYHPEGGIRISPGAVRPMLLWLLLGFIGFPFANGAHIAGLVVGMLYGLARF
jgi:GlpG protein